MARTCSGGVVRAGACWLAGCSARGFVSWAREGCTERALKSNSETVRRRSMRPPKKFPQKFPNSGDRLRLSDGEPRGYAPAEKPATGQVDSKSNRQFNLAWLCRIDFICSRIDSASGAFGTNSRYLSSSAIAMVRPPTDPSSKPRSRMKEAESGLMSKMRSIAASARR